jgi:hypothetical protein
MKEGTVKITTQEYLELNSCREADKVRVQERSRKMSQLLSMSGSTVPQTGAERNAEKAMDIMSMSKYAIHQDDTSEKLTDALKRERDIFNLFKKKSEELVSLKKWANDLQNWLVVSIVIILILTALIFRLVL